MRRASHDTAFVTEDDGKTFVGINLGWDFTAEHEWGIDGIRNEFGIGKVGDIGLQARQIANVPADDVLFMMEGKEHAALDFL